VAAIASVITDPFLTVEGLLLAKPGRQGVQGDTGAACTEDVTKVVVSDGGAVIPCDCAQELPFPGSAVFCPLAPLDSQLYILFDGTQILQVATLLCPLGAVDGYDAGVDHSIHSKISFSVTVGD